MPRYLGLIDDPVPTGSTLDTLAALSGGPKVIDPNLFVPVTTADVQPGERRLERSDEVRGTRAPTAPEGFMSMPGLTFSSRAYPPVVRPILKHAMGGTITNDGAVLPAPRTSKVGMRDYGEPSCLAATVVRDGMQERLSGLAIGTVALAFPLDNYGTIAISDSQAKWHVIPGIGGAPASIAPNASYAAVGTQTYKLQRATLTYGDAGQTEDLKVTNFDLSIANNLIDDVETRFVHGPVVAGVGDTGNIETVTYRGRTRRTWYPTFTKVSGQQITGSLGFREAQGEWELRRKLAVAEKLVVEISAGLISPATVPPSDELIRFTLGKTVLTGGEGAGALVREGDIRMAYEFSVYADETSGKDLEVEFVSRVFL